VHFSTISDQLRANTAREEVNIYRSSRLRGAPTSMSTGVGAPRRRDDSDRNTQDTYYSAQQ